MVDRSWLRQRKFHSLSVRDLLDAREAYHVHLAHLANVFATAIGRYLIIDEDPDAASPDHPRDAVSSPPGPRTLINSSVQRWSWPAILVFVDDWQDRAAFAAAPDSMVPRYLYLPDGRVVPTCVVQASRDPSPRLPSQPPAFPSDLLGGGYPAFADVQGRTHLSSIGCLVTDGDAVYVLSNRHVAGEAGRELFTMVGGARQRLGVSAGRELGKRPFFEIYRGWPGERVLLNLDSALIRIDDVNRWTAQVYGIGRIGPIWDLHTDSFNLDLIDCPVRAHGAASGGIEGRIRALFFRYKTVGGFEYVSDFLIGPREGQHSVNTRPGDSGTLWFEDNMRVGAPPATPELRPFAVQWGGEALLSPGASGSGAFALATCLSTICRELDVELIADWNVGQPETWGAVGHFKIGALACELIDDVDLRMFFLNNQGSIGYADSVLEEGVPKYTRGAFVPLADVADYIWRTTRKKDASNHFADMDEVAEAGPFEGRSLLDITAEDPHENVHPDVWNAFYESIGEEKRGALPFRIWQMYDAMVDYAAADDVERFLCAGGLMAHYVGDACQPLHVSRHHHGTGEHNHDVHSVYETNMLNSFATEMMAELAAQRTRGLPQIDIVAGRGQAAAIAVVALMRRTVEALPPLDLVRAFDETRGRGQTRKLWDELGEATVARVLDGATTLARLWEGAWREGRSGKPRLTLPAQPFAKDALAALYNDRTFVPSFTLREITVDEDNRIVRSG